MYWGKGWLSYAEEEKSNGSGYLKSTNKKRARKVMIDEIDSQERQRSDRSGANGQGGKSQKIRQRGAAQVKTRGESFFGSLADFVCVFACLM